MHTQTSGSSITIKVFAFVIISLSLALVHGHAIAGISTGSADQAIKYYERINKDIGFNFNGSNLTQFAVYLGYPALKGRHIELMPARSDYPNGANNPVSGSVPAGTPVSSNLVEISISIQNNLLALQDQKGVRTATFFAPKIVDYAGAKVHGVPYADGWRKLVYLPAQANSKANRQGMKGAYILFNYAQSKDPNKDPLLGADGKHAISKNNQIILVPKLSSFNVNDENEPLRGKIDNAYFAVFGEHDPRNANKDYKALLFLGAAFDTNKRGTVKQYHVPHACAHCHGHDGKDQGAAAGAPINGKYPYVKPNYIDTDNLYDALAVDFPNLKNSIFSEPLLVNKRKLRNGATTQFDLPEYKARFKVLQELNEQMYTEGLKGMRDTLATARRKYLNKQTNDLFQTAGADQWLSIHERWGSKPQSAVKRGYGYAQAKVFGNNQQIAWQTFNKKHQQLATKMSQFCFRCHSTVEFSVMDLGTLYKKRDDIISYVDNGYMPYGRQLSQTDKDCIAEMLNEIDSGRPIKHDCTKPKAPVKKVTAPTKSPPATTPNSTPATTPKPTPAANTSIAKTRSGVIKFRNEGGYVARFALTYLVDENIGGVIVPIPKVKITRNLLVSQEQTFNIPANAKSINIAADVVTIGSPTIFSEKLTHPNGKTICKKVWGTIFSQGHGACN